MLLHLVVPGFGAQMEAKARSDTSGSTHSLLQVGFARPDCRVVGHVVVRSEELHFRFARIYYIDYVVDCD